MMGLTLFLRTVEGKPCEGSDAVTGRSRGRQQRRLVYLETARRRNSATLARKLRVSFRTWAFSWPWERIMAALQGWVSELLPGTPTTSQNSPEVFNLTEEAPPLSIGSPIHGTVSAIVLVSGVVTPSIVARYNSFRGRIRLLVAERKHPQSEETAKPVIRRVALLAQYVKPSPANPIGLFCRLIVFLFSITTAPCAFTCPTAESFLLRMLHALSEPREGFVGELTYLRKR